MLAGGQKSPSSSDHKEKRGQAFIHNCVVLAGGQPAPLSSDHKKRGKAIVQNCVVLAGGQLRLPSDNKHQRGQAGGSPELCCACWWPTITLIIRSQKLGTAIVQNCVVLAGGQTLPLSKFRFVASLEKLNQTIFSDELILKQEDRLSSTIVLCLLVANHHPYHPITKKRKGGSPELCCAYWWPTITLIIRSQKLGTAIKDNSMDVVPPKKRFLSKAAVEHHNKACKRPMLENEISKVNSPRENFPPVTRSCGKKCHQPGCHLLTIEDRQKIYRTFFTMTDDEKYLFQTLLMSSEDAIPQNGSKTRMKWSYKLPVLYCKVDVCQMTFRTTLDISDSQISRMQDRMVHNNEIFPRNMRGRHTTRPHKIVDSAIDAIHEHLKSYNTIDNHYSRNKYETGTTFLLPHYTIYQIHKDFMIRQGDTHHISECSFRKLFHSLKFRIGKPGSDTCDHCDLLELQIKNSESETDKADLQRRKQAHLTLADLTTNVRKADISRSQEDSSYVVISVDMQQTIFTPQLTCSSAFYLRKFGTYNLCIHDESKNKGHMYLWDECDAKKGADEVASCIYKYITTKFTPLDLGSTRTLVVWSDRCVGQNNNFVMLIFYRKLIEDHYFTKVYQKFMVSGHSYLSCDTDFAFIENQMKNRLLQSPLDISPIFKAANSVTPFEVNEMSQNEFFDLKPLEQYWKRPVDLKVSHYLLFYQSYANSQILTKPSHSDDTNWEIFDVKRRKLLLDSAGIPSINGKRKYDSLLVLKICKQKDLAKMVKFLPDRHRCFFQERIQVLNDLELVDVDDDDANLFGRRDD
ncbi:unnamed protein product [Allacma fusca]|uniref:DUF7869 domain-containing protein n=1 Tax=Allacma fusca TaxID=39272 RepID=A0A8J2NN47_9HEXA|nr:unnamed protein product [Allacma fusca]